MTNVRVFVSYKPSILDPQAQSVAAATHKLGYTAVAALQMGKYFDLHFDAATTPETALSQAEAIADRLLANPNMESYEVTLL